MSSAYPVFEWVVVVLAVAFAGWRVWRTYGPKPRSVKTGPGCDAGCPSCNHCATSDAPASKKEQPIEFLPRRH